MEIILDQPLPRVVVGFGQVMANRLDAAREQVQDFGARFIDFDNAAGLSVFQEETVITSLQMEIGTALE